MNNWMLTENFTIILRLIFVQQHKKNVYQNIKSTFMKRWYQLLYVKWGRPRDRGAYPGASRWCVLTRCWFLFFWKNVFWWDIKILIYSCSTFAFIRFRAAERSCRAVSWSSRPDGSKVSDRPGILCSSGLLSDSFEWWRLITWYVWIGWEIPLTEMASFCLHRTCSLTSR